MAKVKSVCRYCKIEFQYNDTTGHMGFFCSIICHNRNLGQLRKKQIKINCKHCNKEFEDVASEERKFCSNYCAHFSSRQRFPSFWKTATENEKMERWYQYFEKYVVRKDGCWGWKGPFYKSGYALINCGKTIRASRFSYMYHKGPIPDGMLVCHVCDQVWCVAPDHLFLGTQKDNMQDMIKKGRKCLNTNGRHPNAKLTDQQVLEIKNLLTNKIHKMKIARQFNVTPHIIFCIANGENYKNVEGPEGYKLLNNDYRQPNAKLTDQQASEIKKLLQNNISGAKIARQFNVSNGIISAIQLNKTYKNVKDSE